MSRIACEIHALETRRMVKRARTTSSQRVFAGALIVLVVIACVAYHGQSAVRPTLSNHGVGACLVEPSEPMPSFCQ
jgi:hypothetical protein